MAKSAIFGVATKPSHPIPLEYRDTTKSLRVHKSQEPNCPVFKGGTDVTTPRIIVIGKEKRRQNGEGDKVTPHFMNVPLAKSHFRSLQSTQSFQQAS